MRILAEPTPAPRRGLPPDSELNLDSFLLALEAENLSPKTRRTYAEAVVLLGRYLSDSGMPTSLPHVAREPVEALSPTR